MTEVSKILFIITQSEWGGAQRYVFDLATHLPANQFHVMVAAGNESKQQYDGELFRQLNKHGIAYRVIKNLIREINIPSDWKAYGEMVQLMREFKPDIVHLNSSKAGVLGALAAKRTGVKKIIYTVHGFVFNEPMPYWKKNLYMWAERLTARYKTTIICVSAYDQRTALICHIAPESKLLTIHNGIGRLEFMDKASARHELGLPQNGTIIGVIANFYQTKGLTYLIEAASMVLSQYTNSIFVVIGFGQLENALRKKISQLDLTRNFILVTNQQKTAYRLLPAFDIYCLPSVKEGFPFTILEAMQAGLPIISTRVGGIPEMIEHGKNGVLVNPADPDGLAKELLKMIANPASAQALGRQAKADVQRNFSLNQMISATEKAYQR